MPDIADQKYLLNEQYQNAANLKARIQLHIRFSTNRYDWYRWVFDHFNLGKKSRLLEIGCGPGYLWQKNSARIPSRWDVTLSDFSPGMLEEARQTLTSSRHPFQFRQADAQALPFDNESLDAVIANHMLYHVPDRAKAYAEIRRVLKPEGRFYATTNGKQHMRELVALVRKFNPEAYAYTTEDRLVHFSLERGAGELRPWFSTVTQHIYENALLVTEAAPLVAYVQSGKWLTEDQLAQFKAHIERKLQLQDAIYITKSSGLFEAQR